MRARPLAVAAAVASLGLAPFAVAPSFGVPAPTAFPALTGLTAPTAFPAPTALTAPTGLPPSGGVLAPLELPASPAAGVPRAGEDAGSGATSPACGAVVTTDLTLAADLTCATDVGLTVRGDVTIDLRGHRLTGPGWASESTGILVDGDHRVTVVDGTIGGWGRGIGGTPGGERLGANAPGAVVRESVFSENSFGVVDMSSSEIVGSRFAGNATGVWVRAGTATVETSVFVDNSTGAGAGDSSVLTISGSTFEDNELGVECAEASCTLAGSELLGNDTGFSAWSATGEVRGSRFLHNERGAYLTFGTDMLVWNSLFTANAIGLEADVKDRSVIRRSTFRGNGTGFLTRADSELPPSYTTLERNAFARNTDGIAIGKPGASLGGNHVSGSARRGIDAEGAVDLGSNVARGNAHEPQCVGVDCSGA